jgi:D-alanyl-D-alanine endopeptidase (penicillin-binding protein 7)
MHLRQLLLAVSIGLFTLSCAVPSIAASEQRTTIKKTKRTLSKSSSRRLAKAVPTRPSFGQLAGLHATSDDLDLKSSVAYVIDQDTNEVLLSKNDQAVLPIASITKLMTGVVISEAKLSMNESITITQDDVDTEKGSSSRLKVGTTLTRGELLHLALMASENRASACLGQNLSRWLASICGTHERQGNFTWHARYTLYRTHGSI